MKIIVAGFPKTGTKSVSAALRQLGYTVYDFIENIYCLENEWAGVIEHGWNKDTFYKMYKSVDAAVDLPASFFWEQLHEAFPDAKIILTVRDSEEAWLKSFKDHMKIMDSNFALRILQIMAVILQRKTGLILTKQFKFGVDVDRAVFRRKTAINESIAKMKYRVHNEYVKQKAPADKLLVFNCKDGWKPLCNFLQDEVPDCQFPHKNVKGSIVDEALQQPIGVKYQKEIVASFLLLLVKMTLIGGLAFYAISSII